MKVPTSRFADVLDEQRSAAVASTSVRAADVVPEKVEWLWPGRVPFGMTTVLGGFPGVGKSTVLYDLAARVSREGKAVLVVTAEDHLAAVVRPRLEAAGANLALVHIVTVPITLPEDVKLLETLVRDLDIALVTLDPLVAFIGDTINTHRDHHVRRVLAPLAHLAESTGAAVVVVIHTNKGEGNDPLMRISGSIGFTGAARSVLLAADDPQDETRRILAVAKSNLAEFPAPLAYRLVGVPLADEIQTSRVEWLGEAPEVDVFELLGRRADPEERSAREEAIELLRGSGVLDTARLASEIEAEARARGIHEKTLQRARRSLGIPAWRDGFQAPFFWGPRPDDNPDAQPGQPHLVQVVQVEPDLREQGGQTPNLDNLDTVGETPSAPPTLEAKKCPECDGFPWQGGHFSSCSRFKMSNQDCVRCQRHGLNHVGAHIRTWAEIHPWSLEMFLPVGRLL